MNKHDFIKRTSSITERTQKDVSAILDGLIDTIIETVKNGDVISLPGFGSFSLHTRPERNGMNPVTREIVTFPETSTLKFKPSQKLKEFFN